MDSLTYMGNQYRKYREEAGLTLDNVAGYCEMDVTSILKFEEGGELPDIDEMNLMCDCIGITPGILIDE